MTMTYAPVATEQLNLRLITVSGEAAIMVVPDRVIITLVVESWNKDLVAAKKDNEERLATIVGAVARFGVIASDVQTDFVSIEPENKDEWDSGNKHVIGKRVLGYYVRRSAVVTLRDVSKFEALLTGAVEAGANHIQGITFETTELRKYRDEARAIAIKAARDKAVALAGELDQKIGRPQSISEGYSRWGSSYGSWWGSHHGGGMSQNISQRGGGGAPEGAMVPGTISVTADVSVTFSLV
jgi:uncharacterized protein YggE